MARIRTVKPEMARHEWLYESEKETGLPLRFAWAMLPTVCDREGRFEWKPRGLKCDVLPFDDDVDFSRVLDAFATRGFIVKYESGGRVFGCIPTFKDHQVINNKEAASKLPAPSAQDLERYWLINESVTRGERVDDALATPLSKVQGEGKGREREQEGREVAADKPAAPTTPVWEAYAEVYKTRYGWPPVRNAKANGILKQLIARLGADEAPQVAAFYAAHPSAFYATRGHILDCLLADAEKLRTEWVSGQKINAHTARQNERTAANPLVEMALESRRTEAIGYGK